jgi:hypothetical protein
VRGGRFRGAIVSDPLDWENAGSPTEVKAGIRPQIVSNLRPIKGDHLVVPASEHRLAALFEVSDKNFTVPDRANQIMESLSLRSTRLARHEILIDTQESDTGGVEISSAGTAVPGTVNMGVTVQGTYHDAL